jgi:hypothetical protein
LPVGNQLAFWRTMLPQSSQLNYKPSKKPRWKQVTFNGLCNITGARSSIVVSGTATSRKVAGLIPNEVIGFFIWLNPFSRTVALGSTQPLTEMSTKNLPGAKWRLACKAENLTTLCEPIV